jgi:hypothetical protein
MSLRWTPREGGDVEAEEIKMRGDLSAVTPVEDLAADVAEDDMVEGDVVLGEDAVLETEKEALVVQTSPIATIITKSSKTLVWKAVLLYRKREERDSRRGIAASYVDTMEKYRVALANSTSASGSTPGTCPPPPPEPPAEVSNRTNPALQRTTQR